MSMEYLQFRFNVMMLFSLHLASAITIIFIQLILPGDFELYLEFLEDIFFINDTRPQVSLGPVLFLAPLSGIV